MTFNYKENFFNITKNRINLRSGQLKNSYLFFKSDKLNQKTGISLWGGLIFFWKALQYWFLGLFLALVCTYYLCVIKLLPFTKIFFNWIMLSMFLYWMLSGFVFFTKKYNFTKFTSAIQRFWKRSYIVFWLIETSLFLVFFYLTINASAEPYNFYDAVGFYKQHLFSWRSFFLKNILIIVLIILSYFLIVLTKWEQFNKIQILLLPMTLLIIYIAWLETYQVYHLLHFYGSLNWVYDVDERLWNLEVEFKRTRIANHYVTICFLAKYFHILFILVFWLFSVLRFLEKKRLSYPLLSANVQNFIFLYMMSWLYMYPWFKFYTRRYLDYSFNDLNVTTHNLAFKIFFSNLNLYLYVIFYEVFDPLKKNLIFFEDAAFFYWHENSVIVHNSQFIRHALRDVLINKLS